MPLSPAERSFPPDLAGRRPLVAGSLDSGLPRHVDSDCDESLASSPIDWHGDHVELELLTISTCVTIIMPATSTVYLSPDEMTLMRSRAIHADRKKTIPSTRRLSALYEMGGDKTIAVGLPLTSLSSSWLLEEGSGEALMVAKNGGGKYLGAPPYIEGFGHQGGDLGWYGSAVVASQRGQ